MGIREVKARFSHYLGSARGGEDVIITDRGRPVAKLIGVERVAERSLDDAIAELVEEAWIDPLAEPAKPGRRRPLVPGRGVSISAMVRQMRR